MIITIKELANIGYHIGHSCTVGVSAGYKKDEVTLHVLVRSPSGQLLETTGLVSTDEHWDRDIGEFKTRVKSMVDYNMRLAGGE